MNILLEQKKVRTNNKINRVVYLSDILPINFVESVLLLENISIGDDAFSYISPILEGGNLTIYWDKKVSLGNTLRIYSNTTVIASSGCGAVLRNEVNKPMFSNKNRRFSKNDSIADENIIYDGGVWNGNGFNQSLKFTGNYGIVSIFLHAGVINLQFKNDIKFYTPKTYCSSAWNIVNGVYEDFTLDVGSNPDINMDGVHFDGNSRDCRISRGVIRTYDDGIALNADDILYSRNLPYNQNGEIEPFWTRDPQGEIKNILIEDIHFVNSLFGIRLLSSKSRIDNITIKNITGNTTGYLLIIDNYWQQPAEIKAFNKGNVGKVILDNINVTVNSVSLPFPVNQSVISLSDSIEELTITNFVSNTGNVPNYSKLTQDAIGQVYNYGNLTLNGVPF